MTLVIGLTGSIGTGKSTIANRLKELELPVIDADKIARQVVEPNNVAYKEIVEEFGKEVLHEDLTLNRKALGEIVFTDDEKRNRLNAIIHPAIRKEMLLQRDIYMKQEVPAVVMDIPLLFENKLTHYVDKTLVVSVDEETQLERIVARDNSSVEEAKQRIASQIPIHKKAEIADAVIDNDDSIENSFRQLDTILSKWQVKNGGKI